MVTHRVLTHTLHFVFHCLGSLAGIILFGGDSGDSVMVVVMMVVISHVGGDDGGDGGGDDGGDA